MKPTQHTLNKFNSILSQSFPRKFLTYSLRSTLWGSVTKPTQSYQLIRWVFISSCWNFIFSFFLHHFLLLFFFSAFFLLIFLSFISFHIIFLSLLFLCHTFWGGQNMDSRSELFLRFKKWAYVSSQGELTYPKVEKTLILAMNSFPDSRSEYVSTHKVSWKLKHMLGWTN